MLCRDWRQTPDFSHARAKAGRDSRPIRAREANVDPKASTRVAHTAGATSSAASCSTWPRRLPAQRPDRLRQCELHENV